MQDRSGDLLEHVEFADLVGHAREDLRQGPRVQRGTVGRDPQHPAAMGGQAGGEFAEETTDVPLRRALLQHPVGQSLIYPVVHDADHAEGAVIQLVDSQIAAEGLQDAVEVFGVDAGQAFFPPPPRPSSGSSARGKDAVVAPQMPTRGPIGEAVLNDQSHGGPLDPQGVMGLGQGQVGRVGKEASPARRTTMFGLPEDEVDGTTVAGIAEVVKAAMCDAVAAAAWPQEGQRRLG